MTLAGCATTQQEAARLQLNAARIRTAEQPTIVRSAGSAVEVSDVSMLSTPGAHTFVVTVHNPRAGAVTDLPISVGVSVHGHTRVYLNTRSVQELSYFDAHLPRVAGDGTVRWVFSTTRSLPSGAHAFALVGARPSPAAAAGASAPRIAVRVTGRQTAAHDRTWLRITLRNGSTLPQYQLPVYAVALRGRRVAAAGELIVPHLGSRKTLSLRIPVQGSLSGARLQVAALPAIVK